MNIKNKLIGGGVIVALCMGAGIGPSMAAAPSASTSVSSISAPARVVLAVSPATPGTLLIGASTTTATNQQAGAAARLFIEAVKKLGPVVWNAMVKAVSTGYSAFVKWVGTIPGWVQGIISGVGSGAVYDIIKGLLGL